MSNVKKLQYTEQIFSSDLKERFIRIFDAINEKKYDNNWIAEVVDGDKKTFDWGMNFHQCAIHKFYLENGGEELAPYICLQDFAFYHPYKKIGFRRSQTLAGGGNYCDFRFKKGESTPRGWPPEDKEEWKLVGND
jgi:hypothetical protein